ncbi:MAG: hypothetical protein ABI859_00085 [Pseudomonadota bacterium]
MTRDYLLRAGYAYVGYTLSINKPASDPTNRPRLRYYEITGTPHLRLADHGTVEV